MIEEFLDEEEKKEYIDYATQNLNYAKLVHMLGLKMENTGDASLIDRIVLYIDMIIENEKRYVPKLLMLLKAKYCNNIPQN